MSHSPLDQLGHRLSRRTALKSAAAVGAVGLIGNPLGHGSPHALAAPPNPDMLTAPGRLLVVFLRGAADHLSMTVPLDETSYIDARPSIAVRPEDTLQLDDRFGFHPAMPRLHERYLSGQLAPIVAVGNPAGDRSHFVSQELFERGSAEYAGNDADGGWLARHLAADSTNRDSALRAVTVGSNVDTSLIGYGALGIGSLGTFGLSAAGPSADSLIASLRSAHLDTPTVDAFADQAIAAAQAVAELPASTSRNRTAAAFEDIATLFDADLGSEVITTNIDGWDTHNRMGDARQGEMRDLLAGLDDALGNLADTLDAKGLDDVTTIVVTEFGRRVAENGSGGCDHGWGSAALAMGPGIRGGMVHGDWPGLAPDILADSRGDVPMTTDYRDVLGDVVEHVLGGDAEAAFPSHEYRPTSIFRDR